MVDIWKNEYRDKVNNMDCFFNDLSCHYSGNLYVGGVPVGDYTASNSAEVERIAARFNIIWSWKGRCDWLKGE